MVRPMKASELRDLTVPELEQKLKEFKEELFNLRFQHATAQLENPIRIRELRRSIARVKTILHQHEPGIKRA
jgi:large subunit ribosomal protein L29